jgi:3-oxoacyl-[acyl-carrier-protein] synthase III
VLSGSIVLGTGMHVPERVVKNDFFASYLDTSDEWIRERTGIAERRWVEPGTSASALAEPAAREAIANAGLVPSDIDGIICATVTPDNIFPSTACMIQKRLGCRDGLAFDVNAVCSGFLYAIGAAHGLILSGQCKRVLIVGTEIYSIIIDKNDRTTGILFGDGAGALVLGASGTAQQELRKSDRGIFASHLGADGSYTDILCVHGGSAFPFTSESVGEGAHFLKMAGREVFKLAVRKLSEINRMIVEQNGFSLDEVSHFVSHQANRRILQSVAKDLGIPESKFPVNIEKYGNTSAASVPILLAELNAQGTLKKGDLVVLSAFGGGVTWGAMLLRW